MDKLIELKALINARASQYPTWNSLVASLPRAFRIMLEKTKQVKRLKDSYYQRRHYVKSKKPKRENEKMGSSMQQFIDKYVKQYRK